MSRVASPVLISSGVLLLALGIANWSRPGPADAEPYHARVRAAVEALPPEVGPWIGVESEIAPSAVALLRPNAMVSRIYRHRESGLRVAFLLVHTKDARDLAGHYPPNCYPSAGWQLEAVGDTTWHVGRRAIPGKEYSFRIERGPDTAAITVANFIVMPDGSMFSDMGGVRAAAADYNAHFFGAGQVQILFDQPLTKWMRHAITTELIARHGPLLSAMGSASRRAPPEDVLS